MSIQPVIQIVRQISWSLFDLDDQKPTASSPRFRPIAPDESEKTSAAFFKSVSNDQLTELSNPPTIPSICLSSRSPPFQQDEYLRELPIFEPYTHSYGQALRELVSMIFNASCLK